ncbi:hypothetical protein [Fimbriimonas ginsengisoli]|nr:hypothetical protein [Fimbriimonas ginsengisoli]
MIVYGDPSYRQPLSALVRELRAVSDASKLDDLRTLLVHAGELEQAYRDEAPMGDIGKFERVTELAATAFLGRWLEGQPELTMSPIDVAEALANLSGALDSMPVEDTPVTVKVPEGFAFYGLYPEAYCVAALRWIQEHTIGSGQVLVIGIRSIGTTLSAVVLATLRAGGWTADRITVRPIGHTFARELELSMDEVGKPDWVLVVDEGPGLSGSSMASVAEAVQRAGVAADRIAFFPGHGGEPGPQATESVRRWWRETPRYVTPSSELRWNGRSLTEVLAERTAVLLGGGVDRVEDLSGGMWRTAAYPDVSEWPSVTAPFERTKYRAVLQDGRAVLWKHGEGRSLATLDMACGFAATPWIEGRRLSRADASPTLMERVGRYIADAAGPPLSDEEEIAARDRRWNITYWNTREVFGESIADKILEWRDGDSDPLNPLRYGDGRLSPHEWVLTTDGEVVKTDAGGHDCDHTAVGPQPVTWDIAGAWVEWGLDSCGGASLLAGLASGGLVCRHEDLRLFRLAYAAFRLGICSFCADLSGDEKERGRLRRDVERYRNCLVGVFEEMGITGFEARLPCG